MRRAHGATLASDLQTGGDFVLGSDLTISGGGIRPAADTTLDLNGHTLTIDGTFIGAGAGHLVVKNSMATADGTTNPVSSPSAAQAALSSGSEADIATDLHGGEIDNIGGGTLNIGTHTLTDVELYTNATGTFIVQ